LGKLGNVDDSRTFLEDSGCPLEAFNLSMDAEALSREFATQEQVDEFVVSLGYRALIDLTGCCGHWRNNGIAEKLSPQQTPWFIDVPVENIQLNQAERYLGPLFRRHDGWLAAIAVDPVVLRHHAYSGHEPGETVNFRCCLAYPVPDNEGIYRVFDGVHRAIQMVRNRDTRIPICAVEPP